MSAATALSLVTRAAFFASEAHAHHRRKGEAAEPYVNHLAEVAMLLAQAGADANLIAAGYLHDTLEDTDVSYADLLNAFDQDIADLVQHATDDDSLTKSVRKHLQIERAPTLPARAQTLRICDKISNLRALQSSPPAGWSVERKLEYFEWAHAVVAGCSNADPALVTLFQHTYQEGLAAIKRA